MLHVKCASSYFTVCQRMENTRGGSWEDPRTMFATRFYRTNRSLYVLQRERIYLNLNVPGIIHSYKYQINENQDRMTNVEVFGLKRMSVLKTCRCSLSLPNSKRPKQSKHKDLFYHQVPLITAGGHRTRKKDEKRGPSLTKKRQIRKTQCYSSCDALNGGQLYQAHVFSMALKIESAKI